MKTSLPLVIPAAFLFLLTSSVKAQDQYNRLYWTNPEQTKIESIHFNGTNRADVTGSSTSPVDAIGLQADGMHQKIYWYQPSTNEIKVCDLDGLNVQTLVTNSGFANTLYVDPVHNTLYWPSYDNGMIEKVGLDGKGRQTLMMVNKPVSLAVDIQAHKIYWFSDAAYDIRRADLDGQNEEIFIADPGYVTSMFIDPVKGFLYWPNKDLEQIESIKLDGTSRTVILSASQPVSVAVDNTSHSLFWYSGSDSKIYRSGIDGTDPAEFISDPGTVNQLAIAYDNSYLTLPVSWLSFTAAPGANGVQLKWSTASEQNSLAFDVQFSTDGRNWNTIGTVAAAGNSNTVRQYQYQHNSPVKGINYYRILQTGADSRNMYSDVRTVKWNELLPAYSVLSNPVSGSVLQIQVNRPVQISLMDLSGRVILTRNAEAGLLQIPMSAYHRGMYLIRAENQSQRVLW